MLLQWQFNDELVEYCDLKSEIEVEIADKNDEKFERDDLQLAECEIKGQMNYFVVFKGQIIILDGITGAKISSNKFVRINVFVIVRNEQQNDQF